MGRKTYSVTEAVNKIKRLLEPNLSNITLSGEVSNFSKSGSGHNYFNLSDKNASVSVAVFRGDAMRIPLLRSLKDGDQVECFGSISVYAKRGQFQLVCKGMQLVGVGSLLEQFEVLKARLNKEGFFEQKRPLPSKFLNIAVITAEKGAALQDFLNIFNRRAGRANIILVPALVQGEKSAESIRKALFKAIKFSMTKRKLDAIVLTRGGGSIEDLWSFNDEGLAYDLFNCPVPTISAVGHQVDFTICDFVCDVRCETPSAAAEVLTEGEISRTKEIRTLGERLARWGDFQKITIQGLKKSSSPVNLLALIKTKLYESFQRLDDLALEGKSEHFFSISRRRSRLQSIGEKLSSSSQLGILGVNSRLERLENLLGALNPTAIMDRGFVLLYENDQMIKNKTRFNRIKKNSNLEIRFSDGQVSIQK